MLAQTVLATLLVTSPAMAEVGISPWSAGDHAAARLVVAGPGDNGAIRNAAVELRLDAAYLTYWRQPGDAGLPPTFNTAASQNVARVTVDYPAPHLFDEAGGQLFGYAAAVAFPLRVTLADPAKPATLSVALDYAVCASLCLPGHAMLSLAIPAAAAPEATAMVATARESVPRRVAMGVAGTPSVLSATPDEAGGWRIVARAAAPATLFTEAPDGWFFSAVQGQPGADGTQSFALVAAQRPADPVGPAALPLTFTLVAPDGSIEVPAAVDARITKP